MVVPSERMTDENSELVHIYNPKSVVDCIHNHQFSSYWTQSETYEALKVYVAMNYDKLKDCIISMIAGESVKIDVGSFQNDMKTFETKDDVLTLLVHLGYLTYDIATQSVCIPNLEVRGEFIRAVRNSGWTEVVDAVENSDKLLRATFCRYCIYSTQIFG